MELAEVANAEGVLKLDDGEEEFGAELARGGAARRLEELGVKLSDVTPQAGDLWEQGLTIKSKGSQAT